MYYKPASEQTKSKTQTLPALRLHISTILVDMHSHKTITIVTSPPVTTKPLPGCASPTSKGPVQYRIEERSRTVYVTSDAPPSQWEHSLDQIFTLAEESETTQADTHFIGPHSAETQVLISEDSTNTGISEAQAQYARSTNYRSRRSEFMPAATSGIYTDSPRRSSPRTIMRPRILFYHKHDPHYGFTNFSDHSVLYKGKRYPTSEHLFQSFKVSI
jgi:diaminohydroxyphosphoribosylaminopyrimidine deaminase/5-amino-6-(5-phosphoribosylamino)uracil reductase